MEDGSKGAEQEKTVSNRVQLVTRDSKDNFSSDTRDRSKSDAVVHRNIIKKY